MTRALDAFGAPGDLVLDPFGASPRLVLEAARAGRAVLVASSNPINRFLLQHLVRPFALSDLRTALARLAAAPKDQGRLEPFLLDLYRTECARCGGAVTADYFVWEREADGPSLKGYACEHCNHAGEDAATEADWTRVQAYARRGLQHAQALEQVAPAGDPDRQHAEAALAVYPGRALFALITAVNKLGQLTLEPQLRLAAQALLLSAFDAANALWGHPEGRARPLQLSASPRYREVNVWRALEKAVGEWALDSPPVAVIEWTPGGLPDPGTVAVHSGHARDLVPALRPGAVRAVLTVLPRPNQAYWTLSALWAAWLWGRAAAGPIRVALRRRRYDWAWHANALRTTMAGATACLQAETPVLAFIPENEAGFVAAALAGLDGAGFRLTGRAVRAAEGQAVLSWTFAASTVPSAAARGVQERMTQASVEILRWRGEPAPYGILHAAAWSDLAFERQLAPLWRVEDGNPLTLLHETTEAALSDRRSLIRLGAGAEPETGLYWLVDPTGVESPLAERVEKLVVECLRQTGTVAEDEVDAQVCRALRGLLTPDRRLVQACLRSYAEPVPGVAAWRLRPEDEAATRAADRREIETLLGEMGARLGFTVKGEDPMEWLDERGQPAFAFRVREAAAPGSMLLAEGAAPMTLVLPGGRASLVAEMTRRDPRLRDWLAGRGRVVKFRHVRRLADETTLQPQNFAERLAIDPPEHHDPQLPLL